MKKALLSLGIVSILFLGTNNVFAAPMQPNHQMKAPQKIEKHQPAPKQVAHKPNQKTVIVQKNYVAHAPKHHVAPPPPKHHVAHNPQPVVIAQQPYYNYGYNNGFALKIGNFFLSI